MHDTRPDLAALYLKYGGAMRRKAAQVLGEGGIADQAEDVVHDAFESLLKAPPTEEIRSWEAFLIRIVRNKATDRLRSAAFRHAGPEFDVQLHDDAERGDDLADDVADTVDRDRAAARAGDALSVLNAQQRRVFDEYLVQKRPRGEVAAGLGVTPGRVTQIANKAAELLKEAMNREQVADG
ncbi:RNA polymerase sigma factor [Nocardia nepalensis]|uniref:RNA polymerase sigma factor n=1 Tax=Nocardia nepalensis TaxID=3375448 RepID=UPI003B6794EA